MPQKPEAVDNPRENQEYRKSLLESFQRVAREGDPWRTSRSFCELILKIREEENQTANYF